LRGEDAAYLLHHTWTKLVLYSVEKLEKWLAQRRRVSTCDPGPAE
jgi:hypothetical protein